MLPKKVVSKGTSQKVSVRTLFQAYSDVANEWIPQTNVLQVRYREFKHCGWVEVKDENFKVEISTPNGCIDLRKLDIVDVEFRIKPPPKFRPWTDLEALKACRQGYLFESKEENAGTRLPLFSGFRLCRSPSQWQLVRPVTLDELLEDWIYYREGSVFPHPCGEMIREDDEEGNECED